MIAANSILRRLPYLVTAQDRVSLDTLVFACDVLEVSHDRLTRTAIAVLDREASLISLPERADLLASAWSMIDQVHVIRQLLPRWQIDQNSPIADWVKRSEAASKMRNGMDHIKQNIGNIANRRGDAHPLFGALSVTLTDPLDPVRGKDFRAVTVAAGRAGDRTVAMSGSVDRLEVEGSLKVHLEAFGLRLTLSELLPPLSSVIVMMEAGLEAKIRQFVGSALMSEDEILAALSPGSFELAVRVRGVGLSEGPARLTLELLTAPES